MRLIALVAILAVVGPVSADTLVDAPDSKAIPYHQWHTQTQPSFPFAKSEVITGIGFTGRHAEYTGADTWYPSWAADGDMYSPFTDGSVNGVRSWSFGDKATTGNARIVGDNPLTLKVTDQGVFVSSSLPYGGRYPCGSLVYNGVWYYGTYCLNDETEPGYNWGVLGPFVGFRYSTDYGKTWTQTPHTPADPLFPEPQKIGGKVKIGSPHFVDFGKNMQYSPDGKAYLVGHGASDPDPNPRPANLSWITGDQIYLTRVTPSIRNINDASKYEFFGGNDSSGKPIWTKDFSKIKPILDWNNHCGCVTMTYNAPLKKYMMCVTDGWPTVKTMDTYILESDQITGPWKMVNYLDRFGTQAYFVNFPSKFISEDGRTAWLCYSANFTYTTPADPAGGRYAMCLQEVKLLSPSSPKPTSPLASEDNIAPLATVRASSCSDGYVARGAVDMVVDGYPGTADREWASYRESDSAMLRLDWATEQTIDRVWLFDRPNTKNDQITSGMLIFSDGTTQRFGALPDDAKKGLEVTFAPKTVKWMICAVTGTKPGTQNAGLAEITVFKAPDASNAK